jgi:hypothetical protein
MSHLSSENPPVGSLANPYQLPKRVESPSGSDLLRIAAQVRTDVANEYGYGEQPGWRIMFYDLLEKSVARHGLKVVEFVEALRKAAKSAKWPDRYFCHTFTDEAHKRGWL